MMMLPSPRLFKNRWTALLWAAGIVWMALDVIPSAQTDSDHQSASMDRAPDAADVETVVSVISE